MTPTVFIDSDVVISSLLSKTGAAYSLIHKSGANRFISNISLEELKRVSKELNIKEQDLKELIERRFLKIEIKSSLKKIREKYNNFVEDSNAAHIVAGAYKSKAKFLITYNQKDFNTDKIKEDLNIITMRPAQFLQYLRSLE